ncbi:hypothetical protein ACFL6S_26625 [Candidatus Poribacteria bacterium]
MKGKAEMVSIRELVWEVAEELAPQLEEKKTRLVIENKIPAICCERMSVSQIYTNLMSNANKFMGENKASRLRETIEARRHGGE